MAVPVKSTGGGGFSFADKVGAHFLVEMLRCGTPLGDKAGPLAEIHFEVKESGWVLDDLLLVAGNMSRTERCAVSIKSNVRLTGRGLDKEFVSEAWEQWYGVPGSPFKREQDYLGLATVPPPSSVERDWNALMVEARGTAPDRFALRVKGRSQLSAKLRLFESLRLTKGGANGGKPDHVEAARLLARLRVFPFDFEAAYSADQEKAITACREIVRSGTLVDAKSLWERLVGFAAEARTTGGYFDLPRLVERLQGAVELKDFPDHRMDWYKLDQRALGNMAEIRTVVGEDIHFERAEEEALMARALASAGCTAVIGESGCGKSGVLVTQLRAAHTLRHVLWLNAQELTQASQADLAQALALRYSLEDLIRASSAERILLVLDGFEQLHGAARNRAIELARMVTEAAADRWTILVTVQPEEYIEMRRSLMGAGVGKVEPIVFANPKPAQVYEKIQGVPGVAHLFMRRELQPILCNLATLHWVILTERVHSLDSTRPWIGETELIEWIWTQWVGDTATKHVRGLVLRRLGESEGERISGAVPTDQIEIQELTVLSDLEKSGVVRISESAVKFSHDLMGDWARLRSLIASDTEAAERIREKAGVPRWGRAIRLYAQRLVEREGSLSGWKTFVTGFASGNPEDKLASDLFLDGIVFAANAGLLLERVWSELISDKGEILRRLLRRLIHVATVPDWRYQSEMPAEDADLAAAWFRVPLPLYWAPVLATLQRHADDVAREGIFEEAAVCELWLRIMPPGFPGRKEAGQVALALVREVQGRQAEGVMFVGDAGKVVYEAMLQASPEYPDEVSQVALELCGRRKESAEVAQRAAEAAKARMREVQERREREGKKRRPSIPIGLPSSWGPIRLAGPDGPRLRVHDGFRSAVLDSVALDALVSVRPQVAREVLLAVCLDEPKRESEYERVPFELPGFAHWRGGWPEMYWKGGFYRLLKAAPREGLEAILRLVNFATDRWLERALGHKATDEERRLFSLEFVRLGKAMYWAGDGRVFAWNRMGGGIPHIVACALTALEKWMYDLVEKGEAIDPWVDLIFEKNSSLAIAGVLVAVGLKNPKLFTGILQPLLGNWILYQCQVHLAIEERGKFWQIGLMAWANQGEKVLRLVRDWHGLPHRKRMLQDVAVKLMLFDPGTKKYLAERREAWARLAESAGGDRERLEFFLARFDPANFVTTDLGDGTVQIEHRLPAALEQRSREVQQANALNMLMLELPSHARQLLNEGRGLDEGKVEEFFATLQRVAKVEDKTLEDRFLKRRKVEAVAGGIALLVVQHRDWLSKRSEAEQWCLDMLRELAERTPDEPSSTHDALDTLAEGFIGQAGAALLAEAREEWVQRAVVRGVTAYHYASSSHALTTAFRLRDRLGQEFSRLQNLCVLWSVARGSASYVFGAEDNEGVVMRHREMLVRRYLKGRDVKKPMALKKADLIAKRILRRRQRRDRDYLEARRLGRDERRLHRESAGLDIEVLRHGFGFLAEMTEVAAPAERPELIARCSELLEFALSLIPDTPNGDVDVDIEGPLYDFDYWVFQRVAHVMLSGASPPQAREFWERVLKLPVAAHEWVRAFLGEWFRLGLARDAKNFEAIWSEMIAYVLDSEVWSPAWKHGWYHVEDVVAEMMGIRSASQLLRRGNNASLIERMAPLYERWAERWVGRPDMATSFAYFLSTESGSVLLPWGMRRLAAAIPAFSGYDWRRERLTEALSAAVRTFWKKFREQVRSDPELWKAFLVVLNALCARQDAVALAIHSEVTRSANATEKTVAAT